MLRDGVQARVTPGDEFAEGSSAASPGRDDPAATNPLAPTLDRSSEPWVGEFPGLGRVLITADGEVTVEVEQPAAEGAAGRSAAEGTAEEGAQQPVAGEAAGGPAAGTTAEEAAGGAAAGTTAEEPDAEPRDLRERALRYGWGEPLSWVRRGFHMVGGAALGPADSDACVLLLGDPHDIAIVALELLKHDWCLLSDRPTPVTWDADHLMAQPREAPLLVSKRRARKAGIEGTPVRGDTDALAVEVARCEVPRRVAAAVQIRTRRPDEQNLTPLTGHERFEAATSLYTGGALTPEDGRANADVTTPGDDHTTTSQASRTVAAETSQASAERNLGGQGGSAEGAAPEAAPNLIAEHLRLAQLPWARLNLSSKTASEDTQELLKWWDTVQYSGTTG